MTDRKRKVLFLITKSNWGENENRFSFSPVRSAAKEQPLSSNARQAVGEKVRCTFARLAQLVSEYLQETSERVDSVCKTELTQLRGTPIRSLSKLWV